MKCYEVFHDVAFVKRLKVGVVRNSHNISAWETMVFCFLALHCLFCLNGFVFVSLPTALPAADLGACGCYVHPCDAVHQAILPAGQAQEEDQGTLCLAAKPALQVLLCPVNLIACAITVLPK